MDTDIQLLRDCAEAIGDPEIHAALERIILSTTAVVDIITPNNNNHGREVQNPFVASLMKRYRYPVLMLDGNIVPLYELVTNRWLVTHHDGDDTVMIETDPVKLCEFDTWMSTSKPKDILTIHFSNGQQTTTLQGIQVLKAICECARQPKTINVSIHEPDITIEISSLRNQATHNKMEISLTTAYFQTTTATKHVWASHSEPSVFVFNDIQFISCCFAHIAVFPQSHLAPQTTMAECILCFEEHTADTVLTGCGHTFCAKCIRAYAKRQCALCKTPFST